MRTEQLQCLVAVADNGSIRSAAQQVFMTSQAVGLNIKQLEQELGVELLLRTKTGISLTAAGEKTVQFARNVLQEKEQLEFALTAQTEQQNQVLDIHIGSTSSLINIVLPSVLSKMDDMRKKVSMQLSTRDDTDEVIEFVRNGTYNMGLITVTEKSLLRWQPLFEETLQFNTLVRDELVFVRNRKYCYEGQEQLSSADYQNNYINYYNVVPITDIKKFISKHATAISNDLEFHKNMLEKTKAIVAMPGLSYQYFFNPKKYVALHLESEDTPLLHAAIYHQNAPKELCEFVALIRRELYMKNQ